MVTKVVLSTYLDGITVDSNAIELLSCLESSIGLREDDGGHAKMRILVSGFHWGPVPRRGSIVEKYLLHRANRLAEVILKSKRFILVWIFWSFDSIATAGPSLTKGESMATHTSAQDTAT